MPRVRTGSSLLLLLVVIAVFATSGATSLVYETVWARQLHLVFGTSQLAISTLLAAFMGGLALGGFAGAGWARRTARPLLAYAAIEAGIAVYALLFPWLVQAIEPLYLGFWTMFEPSTLVFALWQFALLGLLLLPPTIGMGATLPLLTRFLASHPDHAGRDVGRLYGANTIGAVVGAAAAGFVLLPALGLTLTTWSTSAVNGGLALVAAGIALSRPASSANSGSGPARPVAPMESGASTPAAGLLLIAAGAGLASLVYEVAWFRLLVLLLGGSAYAFSIMLLAFLLGIGIGGWAGGGMADRLARRGGAARVLMAVAWIELAIAVVAWGAMYAYGELPVAWVWMYDHVEDAPHLMWPFGLLLALAIMLPPTLLMGAAFPCLVRAASPAGAAIAGATGRLYGMNTAGAVVGAFAGGFFLLPALHVRGTVLAAAGVNLIVALLAVAAATGLRPAPARGRLVPWTAGLGAVMVAGLFFPPPWNPLLMSSGMYKYVQVLPERTRDELMEFAVRRHDLLFYDEGLSSVVTVARHRSTGNLWLANNGKVDASSQGDLRTQALLGHLPFLFRPDAERVLVIGLASGITAGSVTLHEAPGRIDIIEIEPAIIQASHYFDEFNHRPLDDPRTRLFTNDGRNHLLLTPDQTYDIVSSEPSNPWLTGVSNLFTREFFALGKRKLRPGGVWAQWLQTYCMDVDDLRCLMATFADQYEHVRLFRLDSADLVLLGSDDPLPLDVRAVEALWHASPAITAELEASDLTGPEHLLALYRFNRPVIEFLTEDIPRNTDDNMRIEHSAPLHLFSSTRTENARLLADAAIVPFEAVEDPAALIRLGEAYLHEGDFRRTVLAVDRAAEARPDDPALHDLARRLEEELNELGAAPPAEAGPD